MVQPPSFEALGLVPFQISPHYLDPDPASTHMGETQEERIMQFLEENEEPVVGLREGSILRVQDGTVVIEGTEYRTHIPARRGTLSKPLRAPTSAPLLESAVAPAGRVA